ncbi:MAG: MBL fold metallo-hydrolase [Calditrichaeota bacterium]|nr:MBL fold metallo-hydrolase [Calditrichota bacterium]
MIVQQFSIDTLGCQSYLVGCPSAGVAMVVDPDRDVEKYLDAARTHGLRITHIVETHLHADHVSGNTDLARRTGATIYLHEEANARFPHQPLKDGEVLRLGNVSVQVLHTPGHTPESITLVIHDLSRSDQPWLALTGDLLFVGDAGRPDLVNSQDAVRFAEQLYQSIHQKLASLPDGVVLYPGHGAGSLCGKGIGSLSVSSLGYERQSNPAFLHREKSAFVHYFTSELPEQPGNHQYIKRVNRDGPRPLGTIEPRSLTVQEAVPHLVRGAALVDTRSREAFIQRHAHRSIHLPLDEGISKRAGYVLEPGEAIVLLLEDPEDYSEVVLELARVGFDNILGYLEGGLQAWQAMGLPVNSGDIQEISVEELYQQLEQSESLQLVDVREPWEFAQAHVAGAILIPLGEIPHRLAELDPTKPVAVMCNSGNRSQAAAAVLGQHGFQKIYNVQGGILDWIQTGFPVNSHVLQEQQR